MSGEGELPRASRVEGLRFTAQVMVPNVFDRLKLDFDKYVPVHAANPNVPQSRADVLKATGRNE